MHFHILFRNFFELESNFMVENDKIQVENHCNSSKKCRISRKWDVSFQSQTQPFLLILVNDANIFGNYLCTVILSLTVKKYGKRSENFHVV